MGAESAIVREAVDEGTSPRDLPLVAAVLVLALLVAVSTVHAGWVAGSEVLPGLALSAAAAGCLLARSRLAGPRVLGLALGSAPLAAYAAVSASPLVHDRPLGLPLLSAWGRELTGGRAAADPSLLLLVLAVLFWLLGAWLAWGVLRRHQPLLGAAPIGVTLATNVLNFPDGQDAWVFGFLVVTLGMLVWSTYQSSLASARRRRLALSDSASWDFWERAALAIALLVALGVLAPPLSGSDRTLDIENGVMQTWGRVTHTAGHGSGGSAASIAFTEEVALGGPLTRSGGVVFTYTILGDAASPSYFRGINLEPEEGEWAVPRATWTTEPMAPNRPIEYTENYQEVRTVVYNLSMVRPPDPRQPNLVFYPGRLVTTSLWAGASRLAPPGPGTPSGRLETADRVSATSTPGSYLVGVEQSVATEGELRVAGTAYPVWVEPYRDLPGGYRSVATERAIRDLALRVTEGAATPYDRAVAIETYLRTNFKYTLNPDPVPVGIDAERFFLFTSHKGYCQHFATAMADMLRSLGIPTRLVNGFGPGNYDDKQRRYVVKDSDAHTWPEVYFPHYGWIPFEPTPDGVYFPITRGGEGGASCTGDSCSELGAGDSLTGPTSAAQRVGGAGAGTGGGVGGRWLPSLPALRSWTPVAAVALLLLVLAGVALSRYLQPQTVAGVWRRVTLLVVLAGIRPGLGDTPIEFGDRVAGAFPEAAAGIRQLAVDFAVAAYAPPGLAEARRPAVLAGWGSLRPILLRRAASRLLPRTR